MLVAAVARESLVFSENMYFSYADCVGDTAQRGVGPITFEAAEYTIF